MAEQKSIRQLLHEVLVAGRPLEEVCRAHPETAEALHRRLKRVREVETHLDALFPSSDDTRTEAGSSPADLRLPRIEGYDVQGILGRGGMGVVYKAQHLALNRPVALKMVLAGAFASGPERQRLLREAQAVAALRHPNIVTVHDVGDCGGRPFFTMELVEGQNLAERLAGTPQPARSAAELVATLADAVQSAHQAGIIHRDLKPANVLLTPDGTPKITDFGLARHFEGDIPLTFTGVQVGTPSYMAPEQASGRADALGPGVDVYSLGALLYEMLTGRPPFRGETALETQRQVIEDEPAAPSRLNSKVPRDLETVCLKCLQKAASRRYSSARDLADDLRRFLNGEPITARRTGSLERGVKWVRRRPTRAVALAGGVLMLLASAGAALWVGWQRAVTRAAVQEDLGEVSDSQRASDWVGARAALERAKGRLGKGGAEEMRERIRQAESDLALVALLDNIQLSRAAFSGTGIVMTDAHAGLEYRTAFQQAGLDVGDDTALAAAADWIRRSAVRAVLLGALDDWSTCDPQLEGWVLQVALLVDADPWSSLARDPAARGNRSRLEELARNAPVESQPVSLLLALSRRLRATGADPVPLLRRLQRVHPGDLWVNFELGSVLIDSNPAEALGFLRAAAASRPGATPVHYNLGQVLRGLGRFDEAIHEYEIVLRVTPDHHGSIMNIGVCLHYRGRLADAVDRYRKALDIHPGDATTHSNLGVALKSLGRIDEAVVQHREAVRLDPRSAVFHNNLGAVLVDTGATAEAISEYLEAIRLDPRHALAHRNVGVLFRNAGQFRDAARHFQAATEIEPRNFAAHRDLRGVRMRLGESDRVRDEWRKDLEAAPADHEAWNGYAELCLFLGSASDYHQVCRDLLARFGTTTDPYIAERISRTCLLSPASPAEIRCAVELVEVALGADKSRYADWAIPYFYFARGLAEHRQGRFQAAIAIMEEKASTVLGPAPRLVIAMAQQHLGRTAEARSTLAAAVMSFDWTPPNADSLDTWMYHILRREAEASIIPRWPEFLAGTHQPQDNAERFALIGICQFRRVHHLTARLYAEAFDADPSVAENLASGHRYNAACFAALAAGDESPGDIRLSGEDRAMWRARARQWLRDELAALSIIAGGSSQQRDFARGRLAHSQKDPDLDGLRDPDRLMHLPEAEREQWRALWAEIGAALDRLQEPNRR